MIQKFNWAVVDTSCSTIEVYDDKPSFRPNHSILIKDVELITNSNGTLYISGKEIIFHLLGYSRRVKDLKFTPVDNAIKRRRGGFLWRKVVDYVDEGWVQDKKTVKYEAKFQGYVLRFFTSA
jgi:hypothetical protein